MTSVEKGSAAPAERAADRSPAVRKSRKRGMEHAEAILDAGRRLVRDRGDAFTTQELAKAAGVALQTFYRYFASKDELLLAVIGELVAKRLSYGEQQTAHLAGPVERLRFYIMSTLDSLDGTEEGVASARFIVSAHWDLQRRYPEQIDEAMRPYADMLAREIRAAVDAGQLATPDPEKAAWFLNKLIQSVFHHYAYAPERPATTPEDLWEFCLTALGGRVD